ncbi:hypothetical protein C8F01DRAFT_1263794 [Mycena amicta]|nr:hypothetical protein C8F01DRAFT_1263794 [Mycena amicta]
MAMFQSCNNVTFNGGTYNHVVYSQDEEENFRKIRLGDIHLIKCLDEKELVECRLQKRGRKKIKAVREVVGVRRMYRANIVGHGSNTTFTVMAYEGRGGAARLQKDLDVQACIPRHPNLWQLFGVTMTRNLCALTYHGDLIPWHLARSACRSYFATAIFWYLTDVQSRQLLTELRRRWITQANSLVPFMEDIESSAVEEFFLTTSLVVDYKMVLPDCDITLQGTFMADEVPTEELYLFIKPPRKYIDNGVMRAKGYDPTTTDYAREHGILEPIFHTVTRTPQKCLHVS